MTTLLEQLEWEMLPNEYRGLRRLPPTKRPPKSPPTCAELVATWEAFGIMQDTPDSMERGDR